MEVGKKNKISIEDRKCPTCKKQGFKHLPSFVHHVGLCGKKIKFICEICLRNFSRKDALKRHICIPSLHDCTQCNQSFQRAWMLNRHIKIVHQDFICAICEKVFNSRKAIKLHTKLSHQPAKGKLLNVPNSFQKSKEDFISQPDIACLDGIGGDGDMRISMVKFENFTDNSLKDQNTTDSIGLSAETESNYYAALAERSVEEDCHHESDSNKGDVNNDNENMHMCCCKNYEGEDKRDTDEELQKSLHERMPKKKINQKQKSRLSMKLSQTIRKELDEWYLDSDDELDVLVMAMERLCRRRKARHEEESVRYRNKFETFGIRGAL